MISRGSNYFLFTKQFLVSFFRIFTPVPVIIITVVVIVVVYCSSLWLLRCCCAVRNFCGIYRRCFKFFAAVIHTVFYKRTVVEFQLSFGNRSKFCLNIIIMHQFFMPVAVGKLHIICNGIGKSLALFSVFFLQCFIDHYLNIFTKVIVFWISFGIRKRSGFAFNVSRVGIG